MPVSRRDVISIAAVAGAGAATAAAAQTIGNPDQPAQGLINTRNTPRSPADVGPRNPVLTGQFPEAYTPPPTDIGDLPLFWASFNTAPRRIQAGGWARQVTQGDFQVSEEISGVNMRLAAGGVREMHWHQAAEWGFVSYGSCRVTVLDLKGRPYVADTKAGDLWYFPAGFPHSLQGLGPDGCEFILAFDQGKQSEYNTLLVTDWMAHTPLDILAQNFGVPQDAFQNMYTHNLWIYQGKEPGPLAADQAAVRSATGAPPNPFTFSLGASPIVKQNPGGTVQIADSHNFKVSTTIAAALVTLKPGGLREMHWHPNADEWQYYVKGSAQMGVFNTGPKSVTNNFNAGDIGYIPKNLGHYIKNTGSDDLIFLEIFKANEYQDVSLADWISHTPPQMVQEHFRFTAETIAKFPKADDAVRPAFAG
ncbi:MAG: cupin domain-containing protein [Caulobacteraceae bacterium]|nr:cupin domain-containing protein [Caulobacter sp.]